MVNMTGIGWQPLVVPPSLGGLLDNLLKSKQEQIPGCEIRTRVKLLKWVRTVVSVLL